MFVMHIQLQGHILNNRFITLFVLNHRFRYFMVMIYNKEERWSHTFPNPNPDQRSGQEHYLKFLAQAVQIQNILPSGQDFFQYLSSCFDQQLLFEI